MLLGFVLRRCVFSLSLAVEWESLSTCWVMEIFCQMLLFNAVNTLQYQNEIKMFVMQISNYEKRKAKNEVFYLKH